MKKISVFLVYLLSLIYLEFLFKIVSFKVFFNVSLIYILLFSLFLALVLTLLTSLFGKKTSKIILIILLGMLGLWFSAQFCIHNLFSFYFSFSILAAAGQTLEFASDALNLIIKNIWVILLFMIPFVISIILNKKIIKVNLNKKKTIIFLISIVITAGLFLGSLFINKKEDYSAYNLFFNKNDISLTIEKMGVINAFNLDAFKCATNFREKIVIYDIDTGKPVSTEKKYDYNNLDINFNNDNGNATIKSMNEFFNNETGTQKNEYTGYFEDKNLILFMAESFNEIAVSKELTPTLYKLIHEGFYFPNYYTPTISSTIGGEFQELTGLYAASGFLTNWKSGNNSFPLGISTVFENKGYNTFAYHNNSYTFQSRNKYLAALGFDNFKACGNGLEKVINCKQWPESDVEMIDATFDEYINSEKPFMTFYATVSGHGDYTWTAMSRKYKDKVTGLNYSDKVLAYLAANIELDTALNNLLTKLEESGNLDDTVIALTGDHYPYYLTTDEVNEVSTYKKDSIVEINHSNFILWNNKIEKPITIEKVGSQIDVLPTIYNVFNIPYDSRLIIGKDILSTEPGLAMFGNRSWVSDYGTYYSSSGDFVAKDGTTIQDEYVSMMNNKVSNKITMSGLIITQNYYKSILGE